MLDPFRAGPVGSDVGERVARRALHVLKPFSLAELKQALVAAVG
jgi:hypothetical protein